MRRLVTVSFSLLINLVENKSGSRYVVFKPYLSFIHSDKDHLFDLLRVDGLLSYPHVVSETSNGFFKVVFQDFEAISRYVRAHRDDFFPDNAVVIERIISLLSVNGRVFSSFHDFFDELVDLKLRVNKVNRGFGKDEWLSRIRSFLRGDPVVMRARRVNKRKDDVDV